MNRNRYIRYIQIAMGNHDCKQGNHLWNGFVWRYGYHEPLLLPWAFWGTFVGTPRHGSFSIPSDYVNIAMENAHRSSWITYWSWWLSTAMWIFQRVNLHFPMGFLWIFPFSSWCSTGLHRSPLPAVTYEVLAWGGLACSESFRKELTDFWSLVDV